MIKLLFTDLDGILIDFVDYSFEQSKDAIELVKSADIPITSSVVFYRDYFPEYPFQQV